MEEDQWMFQRGRSVCIGGAKTRETEEWLNQKWLKTFSIKTTLKRSEQGEGLLQVIVQG